MRSRAVIWSAALLACALALGGIVALWRWQGSNIGITVGLPAGVTLITSIIAWAVAARPPAGQTTPDQLKQARQALAERTLERLRNGTPQPTATSLALPASFGTLQIRWAVSSLNRAGDPALGHTDDAASLAGWLAGARERRHAVAVAIIALIRREGPLRLMKFLEMCHQLGVLRPVRASYVFAEDPAALGLTGDPAAETAGGTVPVPAPEPVPLPEPAMIPEPVPQE
jgi:hypothetical protein